MGRQPPFPTVNLWTPFHLLGKVSQLQIRSAIHISDTSIDGIHSIIADIDRLGGDLRTLISILFQAQDLDEPGVVVGIKIQAVREEAVRHRCRRCSPADRHHCLKCQGDLGGDYIR